MSGVVDDIQEKYGNCGMHGSAPLLVPLMIVNGHNKV